MKKSHSSKILNGSLCAIAPQGVLYFIGENLMILENQIKVGLTCYQNVTVHQQTCEISSHVSCPFLLICMTTITFGPYTPVPVISVIFIRNL